MIFSGKDLHACTVYTALTQLRQLSVGNDNEASKHMGTSATRVLLSTSLRYVTVQRSGAKSPCRRCQSCAEKEQIGRSHVEGP